MSELAPPHADITGKAALADDVEFIGVTKRFGDLVAVDDLSLTVRRGEFLALLGPSGCGKTTCLRMMAGFEDPTAGTIRIDGRDMTGVPPRRRPVNTVFQDYALFGHLDVVRNVEFGLKQAGVPREERRTRSMQALEMVRLDDRAHARPSQLSGGQRQRVALARALVLKPKVLLLDEPLAALDLQLRKGMQNELRKLHRELGITFIFVTHDQGEALSMADRIAVMDRGRIEQLSTPEQVYVNPTSAFVASFIGETNLMDGTLQAEAAGGRIRTAYGDLMAPRQLEVAGDVLVGIRPESVLVRHPATPADGQSVTGTVIDRRLIGEMCRVEGRLEDGSTFVARRPRSEWPWIASLAPDAGITFAWETDDLIVLPRKAR